MQQEICWWSEGHRVDRKNRTGRACAKRPAHQPKTGCRSGKERRGQAAPNNSIAREIPVIQLSEK